MKTREIDALVKEFAPVVKEFVSKATIPLLARLSDLERQNIVLGEKCAALETQSVQVQHGKDGRDGPSEDDVKAMVEAAVSQIPAPRDGEAGRDGKDADVEAITATIVDKVMDVVKAIPAPKDGVDGRDGKDGLDGKDADVESITAMVTAKAIEAIKAIPVPKDGTDGRDGKDGIGLAGAVIDRAGELVVTLTDGTQKNLGLVIGKNGDPGAAGQDGFGFEDLSVEMADDGRTMVLRFERADITKEFQLPLAVVLDRGVYREADEYKAGDGTTWAGSFWIAQRESKGEKPGEGDAWRLAVKRGRDGKDGVMKPSKEAATVKI